jgi:FG-GAP repeat
MEAERNCDFTFGVSAATGIRNLQRGLEMADSRNCSSQVFLPTLAAFTKFICVTSLSALLASTAALPQSRSSGLSPAGTVAARAAWSRREYSPDSGSLFANAVTYGSGGLQAMSVAVADVNGDGKPDLLVANQCEDVNCTNGTVGVLLWQWRWNFSNSGTLRVGRDSCVVGGDSGCQRGWQTRPTGGELEPRR